MSVIFTGWNNAGAFLIKKNQQFDGFGRGNPPNPVLRAGGSPG
jgi:hypothetical protein